MQNGAGLKRADSLTLQMLAVGTVVVAVDLLWPKRYAIPFPWGELVFEAVLWSGVIIVVCKGLLRQLRFWVALAVGITAQVWVEKSILAGLLPMAQSPAARTHHLYYYYYRIGGFCDFLGILVWGLTYVLLLWGGRRLADGDI